MTDISDGTSTTVAFAEVKRGNPQDPNPNPLDLTWIPYADEWADDSQPFPECANYEEHSLFRYAGCQFYRGFYITGLYTHTAVPNYRGRDCVHINVEGKAALDRGHQAARSYHRGGSTPPSPTARSTSFGTPSAWPPGRRWARAPPAISSMPIPSDALSGEQSVAVESLGL